jgi:microcompartment protein CcmL/EutN
MHPALALLEFSSIAAGIAAGDAMIKRGPVAEIVGGTVHPGKYLVMVVGEVGAVEEAVAAGIDRAGTSLIDSVLLSDVHPAVAGAVRGERLAPEGEALGVVETATVAATIAAADAAVKGATVVLTELHLADGLGGKAYALFSGTVSDVEAAVAIAVGLVPPMLLSGSVVIPLLHDEMGANLFDSFRFGSRVGWEGFDAAG